MATAAPEAAEVVEEEPKKKKPILLIIGGVVGLIVLIVGIVLGTLFFTGYFNPKPVIDPEHAEGAADGHGAPGAPLPLAAPSASSGSTTGLGLK